MKKVEIGERSAAAVSGSEFGGRFASEAPLVPAAAAARLQAAMAARRKMEVEIALTVMGFMIGRFQVTSGWQLADPFPHAGPE